MRLTHGTISEDGKVFWSYESGGAERWLDPAKFLFSKNRAALLVKKRYATNPEKFRERCNKWSAENPDKKHGSYRNWAVKNKDRIRCSRLKRTYGITSENYNQMLIAQNGVCAICGSKETRLDRNGNVRDLCVDHCHTTGKVRGLLCINCNIGLGKFKDNQSLLSNAMIYLESNTAPASMGAVPTQNLTTQ